MGTIRALITKATNPHIGSTISTASKSSRGIQTGQKEVPILKPPSPKHLLRTGVLRKTLVMRKPASILKTFKNSVTIHQIHPTFIRHHPKNQHIHPKSHPKSPSQRLHPNLLHPLPTSHWIHTPTNTQMTTMTGTWHHTRKYLCMSE